MGLNNIYLFTEVSQPEKTEPNIPFGKRYMTVLQFYYACYWKLSMFIEKEHNFEKNIVGGEGYLLEN